MALAGTAAQTKETTVTWQNGPSLARHLHSRLGPRTLIQTLFKISYIVSLRNECKPITVDRPYVLSDLTF